MSAVKSHEDAEWFGACEVHGEDEKAGVVPPGEEKALKPLSHVFKYL